MDILPPLVALKTAQPSGYLSKMSSNARHFQNDFFFFENFQWWIIDYSIWEQSIQCIRTCDGSDRCQSYRKEPILSGIRWYSHRLQAVYLCQNRALYYHNGPSPPPPKKKQKGALISMGHIQPDYDSKHPLNLQCNWPNTFSELVWTNYQATNSQQ